jgi:hypothetical protein
LTRTTRSTSILTSPPITSPFITKIDWIKANRSLIDELGADQWLISLLSILEGEYPARQKTSPSLRVTHPATSNPARLEPA